MLCHVIHIFKILCLTQSKSQYPCNVCKPTMIWPPATSDFFLSLFFLRHITLATLQSCLLNTSRIFLPPKDAPTLEPPYETLVFPSIWNTLFLDDSLPHLLQVSAQILSCRQGLLWALILKEPISLPGTLIPDSLLYFSP